MLQCSIQPLNKRSNPLKSYQLQLTLYYFIFTIDFVYISFQVPFIYVKATVSNGICEKLKAALLFL